MKHQIERRNQEPNSSTVRIFAESEKEASFLDKLTRELDAEFGSRHALQLVYKGSREFEYRIIIDYPK